MQHSLLVFEIVFYNPCNIMSVVCKGVCRWEGLWGGVGKPNVATIRGTDSGAVFSVGDRDVHNPQDRSRQPLVATWHLTNSD